MAPALKNIDHVHIFVADRVAAEAWYARVLGFARVEALEAWALDGGPLTLADASGAIHLALFEAAPIKTRSTVAFGASAAQYLAWRAHLLAALGGAVSFEDHGMSLSMYFRDPDGNPFEITSYEADALRLALHQEHALAAGLPLA
jgi:catechol-2,3-dioxygenase